MQFSDIATFKKFFENKRLLFLLKLIIVAVIIYFVYLKLRGESEFGKRLLGQLTTETIKDSYPLLLLVFLLLFINWSLEAMKWQVLVSKFEKLNFIDALKGVLTGLSMAFITPHSVGDMAGRVLHINHDRRSEAVGAILLGRIVQSLTTYFFGFFGVLVILKIGFGFSDMLLVGLSVFFIMLWSLFVWLLLAGRERTLRKLTAILGKKITRYLYSAKEFSTQEVLTVLLLSMARYVVFCLQFVIILYVFDLQLSLWILVAGATWMFLAKTIVPIINMFSDLGVREFSTLYFFGMFGADNVKITLANLMLWGINLLVPTIIGLFFVLKVKPRKK